MTTTKQEGSDDSFIDCAVPDSPVVQIHSERDDACSSMSFPSCSAPLVLEHSAGPTPGVTYVIVETEHRLTLALVAGTLRMVSDLDQTDGRRWTCVERDGWLGFYNPVSGTYLGRIGEDKFRAEEKHHLRNEWVVVRPLPTGGHLLQVLLHDCLMRVHIDQYGDLVLRREGGTTFHFYKA